MVDFFRQLDKDNSKKISRAEFMNGVKKAGIPMTRKQLKNATFFAGAGKIVGSFLTLGVVETLVGTWLTVNGLGGAGRMAGRGLDLTCVVTVGADRLGVI